MWPLIKLPYQRLYTAFLVLFSCSVILSCAEAPSDQATLGEMLCDIHQSILAENLGSVETSMKITETIEKELPDYYENHYIHILTVQPKDHYRIMKTVVDQSSGGDWECGAVKESLGL